MGMVAGISSELAQLTVPAFSTLLHVGLSITFCICLFAPSVVEYGIMGSASPSRHFVFWGLDFYLSDLCSRGVYVSIQNPLNPASYIKHLEYDWCSRHLRLEMHLMLSKLIFCWQSL